MADVVAQICFVHKNAAAGSRALERVYMVINVKQQIHVLSLNHCMHCMNTESHVHTHTQVACERAKIHHIDLGGVAAREPSQKNVCHARIDNARVL